MASLMACLSAFGQMNFMPAIKPQAASSETTCAVTTEIQTVHSQWDTLSVGTIGSQYVATITGNICKVRMYLWSPSGSTVTLSLRSDKNGGGTQYGADSTSVNVTTEGWYEFEFTTPVAVSSAFYINVSVEGNTLIVFVGENATYNGATGNFWAGASQWARPSTFEIWKR